ncbi:unnamed protein product [Rotaria sp. Silwood2]|nr:unnamed protein product [Rotaria sp. Silwood2]
MSINDRLNLTTLINTLLSFDSTENDEEPKVYFNISIHAPFIELNRTFFSLFVCGGLMDTDSGLAFSLPNDHQWTFFIEIPHTDKYNRNISDNFNQILPLLSLLNSNSFEEVTESNHKLYIGKQEELVARFLKAYVDRTINRLYVEATAERDTGLQFALLDAEEECRRQINDCMIKNAPELQRNKIFELSFVKFLYRRVRFFTDSGFYRFNDNDEHLGSRAMEQMIEEAKNLSQMNFQGNDYPRIFLVYDPGFSLYLLHTNWDRVPESVKELFKHRGDPAKRTDFEGKNYFPKCLSWLLNIRFDDFIDVMNETKFILTENFTYKLFHVHERKLTKLPLIIEGHTGVGKTFLLKFYSMLLNAKLTKGSIDGKISPRVRERICVWLRETIFQDPPSPLPIHPHPNILAVTLRKNPNLFNAILKQIKTKLFGTSNQNNEPQIDLPFQHQNEDEDVDNENLIEEDGLFRMGGSMEQLAPPGQAAAGAEPIDGEFLKKIQSTLSNHGYGEDKLLYDNGILRFIWKTIINITHNTDLETCHILNKLLHEHITFHITSFPLMSISPQLGKLLDSNTLKESPLNSIKLFDEYLMHTNTKPLFYRLLLHPDITEEQLEDFMKPICQLANEVPDVELIIFFDEMRFDDETVEPDVIRCIVLALALTYYFRLPTQEDNDQRNNQKDPPREKLASILSQKVPDFVDIIERELANFVNPNNFLIPQGVAINQAVREHIFGIVVSIVTRTPLCIIGAPGQSKTLSFQIVLQNLQGPQLSNTPFCKKLPAIDPFFCLGSKYTRSDDIAYILDRAIKREQHYEQNRMETRCVVFLDEASLPDEKKMVLKVLHPYLDECKVAFVAVANKSFDAANANRMICIYRSLPSKEDQNILAYGCLGLQINNQQQRVNDRLKKIISGLCQGYRRLLSTQSIPQIYHDRDFIYMLRQLRFELTTTTDEQETRVDGITPLSLLHALEENFNGISKEKFEELLQIFFQAVKEECPDFLLPNQRRNIPTILHQSMKLDSVRRRLYGRYKLIIDESEDESAVRLLAQSGVLDLDPNKIVVFRMSDFPDDVNNELRNVEILSTIKLCMETGKTILMINTGRIHGSLYDVFNQNFSIMATGDNRKIWSKVAIGPKTIDVVVHEDFQCIVHINRNEFKEIPPPFLSRFQKYSLSIKDFYQIRWGKLSIEEQRLIKNVEQKAQSFIEHVGQQYFYGLSANTLYSCLLGLIEKNDEEERYYLNIHQQYTQLIIKSKSVIEQNLTNTFQCLLRLVLSRLMQLISPESIILKLPTFEDQVSRWICTNYFENQEHFSLENFLRTLTTSPITSMDILDLENIDDRPKEILRSATKVMIFTRTSSHITGLNQQTKREFFSSLNEDDLNLFSDKVDILSLLKENEQRVLDEYRHEDIWRLAHVYTSFECDRNDLFSLYSACRIMDRLDQTQTFYHQLFDNDNPTRSLVRERLFRQMFDDLWKNLSDVRFNDQTKETWILCYTMISKYYPSSKVLEQTQLIDIKSRIEFMNLAHFILPNENLTKSEELVIKLLQQFEFLQQNEPNYHGGQQKSPYIGRYSSIIETINDYIEEKNLPKSTLMIDVQQWIISILKATDDSYRDEILSVFKYLNQPTCPLTLPIKEFLFDELANIYLKYVQRNQIIKDTWDRILLLPTMIQCVSDGNSLENYRLPYHPSVVVTQENARSALLDLFFSHLKRSMTNEVVHCKLINKIMLSTVPPADIRQLQPLVEAIFRQIKDYFLIQSTALLLCQTHGSVEDQADVNRILLYMINNYLSIQNNETKLSEPLQNFLSTIVSKFSWNHLLKVLKSHDVQQQNQQWSTTLSRFFENGQATATRQSSLQMSHQLEFTLASNNEQSIFPHLQQPYEELKRIVDQCVTQNNDEQRWKPFTDWIALNRQGNPPKIQLIEIKVIVLLHIYYEYLCQDRLQSIDSLLPIIERDLDLLVEERLVFRALSQPERSMIGYPRNPQDERNTLNDFFTPQCQNEDELRIRHCLHWIKPVYTAYNDQLNAEDQYQQHVFYFILQKLPEYKAQINQLSLQSEIQANLQVYIDQMPIAVNYEHFKTELYNPKNSSLSLNILRRFLSATGFLEMTRAIYDLSQFYLLLHQTYSLLIERDKFIETTLEDLSKCAEQNSNIVDQRLRAQHHSIIKNGIEAVNLYHKFADGLIQPGACDETQRFDQVSSQTPIHYLVTNENPDEGDIVMRILSVLADYHNGLLELLEKELKNDPNDNRTVLKSLVYDIVSKDVSILQIARDNTGVITLTADDVLWLSKLSRASLITDTENIFEIKENLLKFDFRYIQSYIVRTHLLSCRINFRHIVQKYQYKRYSFETLIPVDKYQISLDLNDDNPSLPRDFPTEYSILERTSLIQVKVEYGERSVDYFTKSECSVINVFSRFMNDPKLGLNLNTENIICFFDENQRLIYDGIIGDLFSVNDQEKRKVRLILTEENRSISFNEILYRTAQDEEKRILLHPNTVWQNFDNWFREQPVAENLGKEYFSYFLKEKNSIVEETDRILSTVEPITIDVISRDSTMKVKISYENQCEKICVLKATKINQLLNNENLLPKLNLNFDSCRDCVLALGENPDQRLSNEDTRKPIGEFSGDDQEVVEFRIALLIQISTSNNSEKPEEVLLFNRKVTIEELFQISKGSERGYKYLASYQTKKIIDFHHLLSDVNETRFLLMKENQFCSIHIRRSTENQLISIDDDQTNMKQDFASFATIGDVYKANHINDQNEYLLFEKDFLPSMETSLSVFTSTSPIEFDVINEKLPIHIIVENSIDKQTINYYCSLKAQFNRLCSIACQFMHLNSKFYQLMFDGMELSDGENCLEDLDTGSDEVKFVSTSISE